MTLKVPLYLIILVVAIPQLSETIYVAALPAMADDFNVTNNIIELTLTFYLIGFGIGVALWGALSDLYGRKPIFLLGFLIYAFSCLGCYFSSSIDAMFGFRFLQAFGASVGSVLGQAVARDVIKPEDRGRMFSIISMAMAFAPAIGPVIGGYTLEYYNWNVVFLVLVGIAIITIYLILVKLPETLITKKEYHYGFLVLYKDCAKQMIKDKDIWGFGFLVGSVNGILFGYFAESPFYFIESLNVSNKMFGLLAFFICIPLLIVSFISKRCYKQNIHFISIIQGGIAIILITSIFFLLLVKLDFISTNSPFLAIFISYLCIFICIVGIAMIIPNCLSHALQNYGNFTGTAASLFGLYYYFVVAAMTALMSYLHDGSLTQLPVFLVVQGILMSLVFYFTLYKQLNTKAAIC